jgi:RNA polymerase sigma factor for flagellar operon FliA
VDDASDRLREYEALVLRIVREIRARWAREADLDELYAAGMAGLVEADRAFDPERGVAFSTFAYHRIRGAVIDDCRRMGHMRRMYRRAATFDSAATDIVASQPPPTGPVVTQMQRAGWIASTLDAMATAFAIGEAQEAAATNETQAPDRTLESDELKRLLREALPKLEPAGREVVRQHYFEGEGFAEIARNLGVSRSTVSRVHRRALEDLRPLVRALGDDDS